MKQLSFEIISNTEIWNLIDKSLNHIFLHKFSPFERIAWWQSEILMPNSQKFKNLQVRNMEFDIQTNLEELKRILDLNTNQLRIYQFERPIPDTFSLEYLPENNREKILFQNGLKHFFYCDFEFITIKSCDVAFLNHIESNEIFKDRILKRRTLLE